MCFLDAVDYAASSGPSGVAAGDFNGDDDMDVVVANNVAGVAFLPGDGTGALGALTATTLTNIPTRIMAAEFSGDSNWDAVVANEATDNITILIADGLGQFAETNLVVGDAPTDIDLQDITNDGSPDVVVANSGDGTYSSFVNDLTGSFTEDINSPFATGVIGAVGIVVGAINGVPEDSWFGNGGDYGATPGTGTGDFMDGVVVAGMAGSELRIANGGDANADNDLDLVAVDPTDDMVYYFQGGAVAAFTDTGYDAGADPSEALLADVTGEGDEDIVACSSADGTVTVFPGNGGGNFGMGVTFTVGASPSGLTVADLNEDGVADIIVANNGDDDVSVLISDP